MPKLYDLECDDGREVVPTMVTREEIIGLYNHRLETEACSNVPLIEGRCSGPYEADAPCKYSFLTSEGRRDICLCMLAIDESK